MFFELETKSQSNQTRKIALARRYRPMNFGEVVGQEHVVRVLSNALQSGRLHHAYMLNGTRGVGKTTLARVFAKALNCLNPDVATSEPCNKCQVCNEINIGNCVDVLELDAASHTQVDSMRELIETAQYPPISSRFKIYIIDEVHMLSKHAFNAMLKTLEEPPDHAKFILATTDPQMVPATVQSRCVRFSLKRLDPKLISNQLVAIMEKEGLPYQADALTAIAEHADGSMRDALSILDEAINLTDDLGYKEVIQMVGALHSEQVVDAINAVIATDAEKLREISEQMYSQAVAFDVALGQVAKLLHQVAMHQALTTKPLSVNASVSEIANAIDEGTLQAMYEIALHGRSTLALAPDHRSGFEMTMLRMLIIVKQQQTEALPTKAPVAAILKQVERTATSSPSVAKSVPQQLVAGKVPANPDQWQTYVEGLLPIAKNYAIHCSYGEIIDNKLKVNISQTNDDKVQSGKKKLLEHFRKDFANTELLIEVGGDGVSHDSPYTNQEKQTDQLHQEEQKIIEASEQFAAVKQNFPESRIKSKSD